jgi:hypothetical protein
MSTGLFDSPTLPFDRRAQPASDVETYRSLSGAAIAAVCVAVLSPLAFLSWSLVAVPFMGLVLAGVALRDVSQRSEAVTGLGLARGAMAGSVVILAASITTHAITYVTELPEGFERVHYGMLQPLPGDPPTAIPETATSLNGKDVLLKGYMYPGSRQRGITEFVLCRDQGDCCFGGDPKLTDRVLVRIADPKHALEYTQRLVKIAGRFRVEPAGAPELGGGVIYHIDDAFSR